jgi:predicted ATPase
MKLNFRDEYDNLIEAIKQISPEISDILVNPRLNNEWEIQFKEANISPILNVQNISKGTREIAMMLVILELSHEKSTILIEEPEVHLYPLAIKKLKDIMLNHIKRKNLQIIISTHSEVFLMSDLDPVQNKDIKFFEFDKRNGVSSIIELKEDKEISEARDRISIQ